MISSDYPASDRIVTDADLREQLPVLAEELGIGGSGSGVEEVSGTVVLDGTGPSVREFWSTSATTFKANGVDTLISSATGTVWRRTASGSWGYQAVPEAWTTPAPSGTSTPTEPTTTQVTPAAPTFDDTADTYTIPSTTGVDYLVGGVVQTAGVKTYSDTDTDVTVTAQARSGYTLTGTTQWTLNFTKKAVVVATKAPNEITGLAAWWDASDAATLTVASGAVSAWADKSGAGRNLTQATATKQPVTTTVGSKTGIKFDGVDDLMQHTGSVTGPLTTWTVTRLDALGGALIGHASTWAASNGGLVSPVGTGVNTGPAATAGQLVFAAVTWNGTGGKVRLNAGKGTHTKTAVNAGSPLTVGAAWNSTTWLNGVVCEQGIHTGELSDADLDALYEHLKQKWGIA